MKISTEESDICTAIDLLILNNLTFLHLNILHSLYINTDMRFHCAVSLYTNQKLSSRCEIELLNNRMFS